MNLWFTEHEFTYKNVGLTLKIKKQLHHEQTPFQVLDIYQGPILNYHIILMKILDYLQMQIF